MSQAQTLQGRQLSAFVSSMSRKRTAGTPAYTCDQGHAACSVRAEGPCLVEVLEIIRGRHESKMSGFAREHAAAVGAAQD